MKAEMEKQADVWVFKTNIIHEHDVQKLVPFIEAEPRIKKWNVDREDYAKVLRIESHEILPSEISLMINQAGYTCEELTD